MIQLNDVAFTTDGAVAVAVGNNTLMPRSTDAGQTWQPVSPPAGLSNLVGYAGIAFASGTRGSAARGVYCTGCPGQTVVSTFDAGATWGVTYQNANLANFWRIGCDSVVCIAVGDAGSAISSSVTLPIPGLRPRVYLPL